MAPKAPRAPRDSPKGHWCFTVNNPTADDLKNLWVFNAPHGPAPTKHELEYIIIGAEHWNPALGQTRHLQGYLEIGTKLRRHQLHAWFPRAHFEPRYGKPEEARDYCKKEGMWRQRGTISSERAVVEGQKGLDEYWKKLIEAIQAHERWVDVCCDPALASAVMNRMQWAKTVWESRPQPTIPLDVHADGYRWQARFELFATRTEPDDRHVIVVVNPPGNIGKTAFVKYMLRKHSSMIGQCDNPVASASLYGGQRLAFFDVKRSLGAMTAQAYKHYRVASWHQL